MKDLVTIYNGPKGLLMKTRPIDNIQKVSDGMRDMLDARNWQDNPMSSVAFVRIVSHLVEMMRRSGYDPITTSDFMAKAIQESQSLAQVKRY